MNCRLPNLTAILALGFAGMALAQSPSAHPLDGQALVAQAARQLAQRESVEAKIRQRVHLFDQQLVGSGTYRQYRQGAQQYLRLELKIQAGNQVTSLQQVADRRFLWIHRDLPGRKQLGRIDLEKIRRAAQQQGGAVPAGLTSPWMLLGGLPALLQGLNRNFQFGPAAEERIGNEPVWVVEGHWKAERLLQLAPDSKAETLAGMQPQLPPHLPDGVLLVLGRDRLLPLFPFRVEFIRHSGDDSQDASSSSRFTRSLVSMELFEVRVGTIQDLRQFNYQAGDQEVDDLTPAYLKKLGLNP